MPETLTWRVYRDRDRAPVPVVRAGGGAPRASFVPSVRETGDRLVVGPFERAEGLSSGATFGAGDALPAAVMAAEPVLLEGPGGAWRLARPTARDARRGSGPCPYWEPRVVYAAGAPALLVPGVAGPGEPGRSDVLPEIGRGVYRAGRGLEGLADLFVGGGARASAWDYDPYHGAVLLLDAAGRPLPGQLLQGAPAGRSSWLRGLSDLGRGTHPVEEAGAVVGHVLVDGPVRWEDTRRVAPVGAGRRSGYGRVGHGQMDGSPLSDGHLWVIETTAPPTLLDDAVERTMPAGTLYRATLPPGPYVPPGPATRKIGPPPTVTLTARPVGASGVLREDSVGAAPAEASLAAGDVTWRAAAQAAPAPAALGLTAPDPGYAVERTPEPAFADDTTVRLSYPAPPARPLPGDYTAAVAAGPTNRPVRPGPVHYTAPVAAAPTAGPTRPRPVHYTAAVAAAPTTGPTAPGPVHFTAAVEPSPDTTVQGSRTAAANPSNPVDALP